MILSHRHRFIFIKTAKTAGTSIEFALATLCGPEDVVTPVSEREERERGEHGARNWVVPLRARPLRWWWAKATGLNTKWYGEVYYNHMGAARVRALVGEAVWSSYRKVAVERNPWDREVSNYFYRARLQKNPPSFRDFVLDDRLHHPLKNFHAYSIDGRVAVDRVLRFERLEEDLGTFLAEVGIDRLPPLPRQKGNLRPKGIPYRDYYDDETREKVARLYAPEIALMGYRF
ncbi:sulfotransferase family 2 domain-containing protein [Prosthecomicrobium sp. N25]|uniref:sulfotransferase family 2 domain-containing protein n=1 Tax=Prosthecomicrobium sp. N25 TaxID=3129254 RepID=UPI0030786BFC